MTQEKNSEIQRPTSITVISIIGIIGVIIGIPLVFLDFTANIAAWYPAYLGISCIIGLISMIGLWKMKKWGAYLYSGFVVLNQAILLLTGLWSFMALVLPGIVVLIALFNIKKMT